MQLLRLSLLSVVCLALLATSATASADEPLSGTVRVDPGTPGYVLDDGYGRRSVDVEVHFDERFARPPGIAISLVAVEAGTPGEKRVSIKVVKVFEAGFILRVTTWGDAAIDAVEVDWRATPQ